MLPDPLRLAIALVPLVAYGLVLGILNARRRPFLTTGGADLATLGVALTGLVLVGPIEFFDVLLHLQTQRRLTRSFLAEHDGRRGITWISVNLVPGGMVNVGDAVLFENLVGLGILLRERIAGQAVVGEKILNLHR